MTFVGQNLLLSTKVCMLQTAPHNSPTFLTNRHSSPPESSMKFGGTPEEEEEEEEVIILCLFRGSTASRLTRPSHFGSHSASEPSIFRGL